MMRTMSMTDCAGECVVLPDRRLRWLDGWVSARRGGWRVREGCPVQWMTTNIERSEKSSASELGPVSRFFESGDF